MLFTRYHQERVRELEKEVAALKAEAVTVQRLLSTLETQHATLNQLARIYSDGIARAREIAEQAEQAMANPPWASGPLHMTEDEEDLRYMRDHNLITQSELEDALAEAGLEPTITRL